MSVRLAESLKLLKLGLPLFGVVIGVKMAIHFRSLSLTDGRCEAHVEQQVLPFDQLRIVRISVLATQKTPLSRYL